MIISSYFVSWYVKYQIKEINSGLVGRQLNIFMSRIFLYNKNINVCLEQEDIYFAVVTKYIGFIKFFLSLSLGLLETPLG